jgi:hypothetical protein
MAKISHSIYLNYIHIDYCDLAAKTESQDYTLSKFATTPVDMSTCDGTECSLRVDLITSAVLPISPAPPASATPSPAPTVPALSPSPPASATPSPAPTVPALSPSPPASATPSPAPTVPALSPTPPTGASASPFPIASSRAYEVEFLIALFFTLLIEVSILFAMARLPSDCERLAPFDCSSPVYWPLL